MGLETFGFISDLVATNPVSGDPKSEGDDQIRGIKKTLKDQFPGLSGAVTATHTELNYVDGVTSAIQTQLDLKAPIASPTFTGVPQGPTADTGDTGTQLATLDFVIATSLAGTLPGQTGNASKFLTTDGTNASWGATLDLDVVAPAAGTRIATTTGTETLTDKTATDLILADDADPTKKANFVLSGVTAGQNRALTIADEAMTLFTPYARLLSKVVASNSATVDLETTFDSTYDEYLIVVSGLNIQTTSTDLRMRMKIGGSYLTGAVYRYRSTAGSLSSSQTEIELFNGLSTAVNVNVGMTIRLDAPTDASHRHTVQISGFDSNSCQPPTNPTGQCTTTGALTGIRFYMSSGNITNGNFKVFGIRKS